MGLIKAVTGAVGGVNVIGQGIAILAGDLAAEDGVLPRRERFNRAERILHAGRGACVLNALCLAQ